MPNEIETEWSHGKVRTVTRAANIRAIKDPKKSAAGRLGAAVRWRARIAPADGIVPSGDGIANGSAIGSRLAPIIDPATCPAWLRDEAEDGAIYRAMLVQALRGRDELHPMAANVAVANTLSIALVKLAIRAKAPARRAALMAESRAWHREHRSGLATLSALSGGLTLPTPDERPFWIEDDEPTTEGGA